MALGADARTETEGLLAELWEEMLGAHGLCSTSCSKRCLTPSCVFRRAFYYIRVYRVQQQ